jgi:hypothetical protein
VAYPTYLVGALLAQSQPIAVGVDAKLGQTLILLGLIRQLIQQVASILKKNYGQQLIGSRSNKRQF